jgi:hypothetical protein
LNAELPPEITLDEILQLAPDNIVLERARLLLSSKKWPVLGQCGAFIWGECRSKGSLRYKIAADPVRRVFFSNSPAILKPDKFLLALLLKWYDEPECFRQFPQVPEWAIDGLQRSASVSPQPTRDGGDTRMQSREKRMAIMQAGVHELRQWLHDVARQGLAALQMQDVQAWEAIAARLTDYKLAGPARRIRAMQDAATHPQWPEIFADHIAALMLWAASFSRFEELPSGLQEELLIQGGQNARKEDALQNPPAEDRWFIFHSAQQQEGQLNIRRTWLWGELLGVPALLLDYVWGGETFVQEWKAGEVFSGKMYYYLGATYLRAQAGEGSLAEGQGFPQRGQCASATVMARQFAQIVADNPWISVFPFLLSTVTCPMYMGTPCLLDQENKVILLDAPITDSLAMLGLGSGGPLLVFGLWNGKRFRPLSAQRAGTAISLFFDGGQLAMDK